VHVVRRSHREQALQRFLREFSAYLLPAEQLAADAIGLKEEGQRTEVRRQGGTLVALTGARMDKDRPRRRHAGGIAERLIGKEDPLINADRKRA
jgi:hypothetical protein